MNNEELLARILDRLDGRSTAPADVVATIDTLVIAAWSDGLDAPRPHPDDAPVLLERLAAVAARRVSPTVRQTAASRLATAPVARDLAAVLDATAPTPAPALGAA